MSLGCFGSELESFEQFAGGQFGISFAVGAGTVETSEGAPRAGFQGGTGFTGIEGRGGEQFGVGFVLFALAGEQQAEREMRFEGIGIGFDGAAVEAGGGVEMILVVGDVSGVEEGAGVGCVGGEVGVEFGGGGLPVGFGDGRLRRRRVRAADLLAA